MESFKLTLTCQNISKTFPFPKSYEELLTTIGKEFNIDKYDQKKIKYLILVDGEGDSYKIKKKSLFKGFREIIEDQKHTKTQGIFNYDGDIQKEKVQHSDEHNQPSKGKIQQINGERNIIKGIQYDIHVYGIHTNWIYFFLELNDKRIATCGDKSISIVSLDYETKKWKQDIKQVDAHSNDVYGLCALSNKRLVSCFVDYTLKV